MDKIIDLEDYFCPQCNQYASCNHIQRENLQHQICKIHHTLKYYGNLILRGKVIDEVLSELMFLRSNEFFHDSLENKLLASSKDRARRGFSPMNTENFATLVGISGKANDSVEKFRLGPLSEDNVPSDETHGYYSNKAGRVHFFPNDFSKTKSEFEQTIKSYYQLMVNIGKILVQVLEFAYELPPTTILSNFDKQTSILSLNYYPNLLSEETTQASLVSGSISHRHHAIVERIADHTDVSLFTIVSQLSSYDSKDIEINDDSTNKLSNSSLQMLNYMTNQWEDIPYLTKGSLLVNMGDYIQHICGSELVVAARHRVISNELSQDILNRFSKVHQNDRDLQYLERFTSAFFFAPNYNAVIPWQEQIPNELVSRLHEETLAQWHSESIPKNPELEKIPRTVDYDTWRKMKIQIAMKSLKK